MAMEGDGIPVLTDVDKTKYLVEYLRFLGKEERQMREKRAKMIRG